LILVGIDLAALQNPKINLPFEDQTYDLEVLNSPSLFFKTVHKIGLVCPDI